MARGDKSSPLQVNFRCPFNGLHQVILKMLKIANDILNASLGRETFVHRPFQNIADTYQHLHLQFSSQMKS